MYLRAEHSLPPTTASKVDWKCVHHNLTWKIHEKQVTISFSHDSLLTTYELNTKLKPENTDLHFLASTQS
jgi:hypothetical protein